LNRTDHKNLHRVAFYGGSFDPPHVGHVEIARVLTEQFELDEFVFVPAFHAPHKVRLKPTSAYDRYTMLCLVTANMPNISVSKMEIEVPERPYSIETLSRINTERPDDEIFFVMGADSWMDIKTWREWEKVLSISNHIVITRPGYEIGLSHVTNEIRTRIVDLRGDRNAQMQKLEGAIEKGRVKDQKSKIKDLIFITDSVNIDISATAIRSKIRSGDSSWREEVPVEVAIYLEKYQIYS
jgi:nicotinate (nicotinamide) nucleotide adenylyltransferase